MGRQMAGPIRMDEYKRSVSPGATATKPKYVLDVDDSIAYFKFGLNPKEICAELLSFAVATKLDIPVARVEFATVQDFVSKLACLEKISTDYDGFLDAEALSINKSYLGKRREYMMRLVKSFG